MNPMEATKIMDDEYSVKILVEASRKPTSVLDISYKLSIPIAVCHNRVKMLEENDLIHCLQMPLSCQGPLAYVYITDVHNMETLFSNFQDDNGSIDVSANDFEDVQA